VLENGRKKNIEGEEFQELVELDNNTINGRMAKCG